MKDLCDLFANAEACFGRHAAATMLRSAHGEAPHNERQRPPWAELDPTCDWSFGRLAE